MQQNGAPTLAEVNVDQSTALTALSVLVDPWETAFHLQPVCTFVWYRLAERADVHQNRPCASRNGSTTLQLR
jgi:hypothetical protein